MGFGLYLRIALPVCVIIAMTVGLAASMNYAKFVRTFETLETSRLGFVLADLKGAIENGLDLGVDLQALERIDTVIEETLERDDRISSLVVFDMSGKVLFQAGKSMPSAVSTAWTSSIAKQENNAGPVSLGQDGAAGMRLVNNFGVVVGGVALQRKADAAAMVLDPVFEKMTKGGLVIMAVSGLLTLLLVGWQTAQARRSVKRLEDEILGSEAGPLPVQRAKKAIQDVEQRLDNLAAEDVR